MKKKNENYNKKIFISNIITFIVLLVAVIVIIKYFYMLNYESSYLHYVKYGNNYEDYKINYSELNITGNKTNNSCSNYPTEEFKIGYDLIIPVTLSFILILNTLKYVTDKIYKEFHKRNITF